MSEKKKTRLPRRANPSQRSHAPAPSGAAPVAKKRGSDFVMVRLTKFGVEYARGGALRVVEGRLHEVFEAGKPKRVTRGYEWEVLRNWRIGGQPLFETVEEENK